MSKTFSQLGDRLLNLVVPATTAAAVNCWKHSYCKTCTTASGNRSKRSITYTCCSNGDCYYTEYSQCGAHCFH